MHGTPTFSLPPRSMHDEREGLLGLIGVVTRVLNGVYDNCSSVFT